MIDPSLTFLNLVIQMKYDGALCTHRKPTATNSLLIWDSHHPEPYKRAPCSSRLDLLTTRKKSVGQKEIKITGTYDNQSEKIKSILILEHTKVGSWCSTFYSKHSTTTYGRGRLLGDPLVHSHNEYLPSTNTWLGERTKGMFRRGSCKTCPLIMRTKTFLQWQRKYMKYETWLTVRPKGSFTYVCALVRLTK